MGAAEYRHSQVTPNRVFGFAGFCLLFVLVLPLFVLASCLDFATFSEGVRDREVWRSILVTVVAGLAATGLGLLTGMPLAFVMSRMTPARRAMVESLTEIPIVLPPIIAGIALLQTVSPGFALGRVLQAVGFTFIGNVPGVVLAMYFVGVPFIVKACLTGFLDIDPRYEHAARSLGAGPWTVFFRITLPMCWKPVVNGCVLMYGRSMGIFGTVALLAASEPTVPVLVYERYMAYGLRHAITPAVILTAISLGFFVLKQFLAKWLGK